VLLYEGLQQQNTEPRSPDLTHVTRMTFLYLEASYTIFYIYFFVCFQETDSGFFFVFSWYWGLNSGPLP
jgi:hypothetical protein